MRILLVFNANSAGSNFYRLEMPHVDIHNNYPVQVDSTVNIGEVEDFGVYDFVLFSRAINYDGNTKGIVDKIHSQGSKVVLDMDDYWILGENHLLYNEWKQYGTSKKIKEAVDLADHIICTTKYLAQSFINKDVHIIPNAVLPEIYKQFRFAKSEPSYELRLGWLGGSCHNEDIELLYPLAQSVRKEKLNVSFHLSHNGEANDVYEYYKRIVTDDYRNKYEAIPTSGVYEYAMNYNKFEVALAPLANTLFNTKKSELKVIEAGFHKKALIVSDVRPYSDVCNDKNSIICKYPQDWTKAVKRLLSEPNLVKDLGEQLYLDVQKFHVKEVNKKRFEVYSLIAQK